MLILDSMDIDYVKQAWKTETHDRVDVFCQCDQRQQKMLEVLLHRLVISGFVAQILGMTAISRMWKA